MNASRSSFGNELRRLRGAAALSQEELAERAGLSRSGISLLERGKHPAPRLETVRMLADGLKLNPGDRAALLAAARPELWRDIASSTTAGRSRPVSLPTPLTRLIGRETQAVTLRSLLSDPAVRLVTLTGPGGVGKTRLAIDVAAGLAESFPDGVFFVDLAPLTDAEMVISTVSACLGVQDTSGQGRDEALRQFLSDRRLLLLLDNCERVLGAGPSITSLLSSCGSLTILATARQPFRVRGEHELPLPPLPLPAPGQSYSFAAISSNPAVTLFAERASAVLPDFALAIENAAIVLAICQRLDGLPLAIELAAARVRVLPLSTLSARLERRLPLLTGGGLDLPSRQRTMRATIDWSYDLLDPQDQALFRRLAVFAGGFTLEAAEALNATESATSVLDGIGRLVEQSLLRQITGPEAEPRYLMLETLREFGFEQLDESRETTALQQAHAAYFVEFAERGYIYHLALEDSVDRRYRRIEADHANIVIALNGMATSGNVHGVARLAGALALFWQIRPYLREGRYWLDWALAQGAALPPSVRCRVLAGLGSILWGQGQFGSAAATARESLNLAEEIGDKDLVAYSVHVLGLAAAGQERWPEAEVTFTRALELWRVLGVRAEEAIALQALSGAAYGMGNRDLSAARAEEALALACELNHAYGAALALCRLARLAHDAEDIDREAAYYQQSLQYFVSVGNRLAICDPIGGLSVIASARGQPELAVKLVGGVDAIIGKSESAIWSSTRESCERSLSAASALLGEQRCAELRAVGRALRLEEIVALAGSIRVASESTSAETARSNEPIQITSRLTLREVEA